MSYDDDGLRRKPGEQKSDKCDICDRSPSVWCPKCPRRLTGEPRRDDQGFGKVFQQNPELAKIMLRNAKSAKVLSTTSESHPAYPMLDREYCSAGMALLEYWERQRIV